VIPVFLHDVAGTRGFGFEEFEARVVQICEEHQRDGRACAFAFVLHDAQSPHLGKVLGDPEYWAALDAISGKALTVFSIFTGTLRRENQFDPQDHSSNMRRLEQGSRRVIDVYFGVADLHFPSVLFFQVNEGQVLASRLVKLQSRGVEAAYQELSDLLRVAAESVRDSTGKPIRNPEAAYERLDRALTSRSIKITGKKLAGAANAVLPWLEKLFAWG
jgi:hypothetical protein